VKTPPYRRNSGDLAKPGPVLRRYWLILFMLGGILAMVALIAGSRTGVVLECWLEAAFIIPVVLVAAMVGMALTLPLAKEGLFAHSSWPDGLRAIMAIALGLGVLALATLALGACHALAHGVPMIMLAFGAIIGYIPTRTYVIKFDRTVFTNALGKGELALLLACVPIAVMAIAATVPPGHQWASEFGGYDVMEYHLEMPREYVQANATAPVQHNVYSFLPANVEMLYVLLMLLTRSAGLGHLGAVYPAQMLHMIMMLLTAGGLALAPVRMGGVTGGGGGGLAGRMVVFVALLAVPWVEVTGSMAYDEGGVMLFGALALGIVVGGHRGPWSVVATGLLIGLAVGSKMTAGVLVAAPLGLIVLIQRRW